MLGDMMKGLFDYDFKCVSDCDYELEFTTVIKDALLKRVFNKSIKVLRRVKGISVDGNPDTIGGFDIDKRYLKLVALKMRHVLQQVRASVQEDGIIPVSCRVLCGKFKRVDDDWVVTIKYGGEYHDKRNE